MLQGSSYSTLAHCTQNILEGSHYISNAFYTMMSLFRVLLLGLAEFRSRLCNFNKYHPAIQELENTIVSLSAKQELHETIMTTKHKNSFTSLKVITHIYLESKFSHFFATVEALIFWANTIRTAQIWPFESFFAWQSMLARYDCEIINIRYKFSYM